MILLQNSSLTNIADTQASSTLLSSKRRTNGNPSQKVSIFVIVSYPLKKACLTAESKHRLRNLISQRSQLIQDQIEQKYKVFENSQLGCKDAEEIQLRNDSMKRMAIMRQKKIILNDFIRTKKKEMLMEQEKQEEAQRRVDILPIIKMIEV